MVTIMGHLFVNMQAFRLNIGVYMWRKVAYSFFSDSFLPRHTWHSAIRLGPVCFDLET